MTNRQVMMMVIDNTGNRINPTVITGSPAAARPVRTGRPDAGQGTAGRRHPQAEAEENEGIKILQAREYRLQSRI